MTKTRKTIWWLIGIGILSLVLALPSVVHSQTVANPTMTLHEAHGMQHVIADGDILILVRYELPLDEWRVDQDVVDASATTTAPYDAYMQNATCYDDNENDPTDACFTSLLSGVASQYFYSGDNESATLISQRNLPRVGHGLSALYIGTGHSLTFGNSTYETCLVGSATLFAPADSVCQTLLWHTVTDADGDGEYVDDARNVNDDVWLDVMSSLEGVAAGKSGRLVSNGKILTEGIMYAREAFTNAVRSAPNAFAISESPDSYVAPSGTPSAAEQAIQAESTPSAFYGYISDFNDNHFSGNLSINTVGGVLIAILGLFFFGLALMYLKNLFMASIILALFVFGFGVLNGIFPYSLFLIVVLVVFGLGAFKYVRNKV